MPSRVQSTDQDSADDGYNDVLHDDHPLHMDMDAYTSPETSALEVHFLGELLDAPSDAAYWKAIARITGRQQRPPLVTANDLQAVFAKRMAGSAIDSADPVAALRITDRILGESCPHGLPDTTPQQHFSRIITAEEVAAVKDQLRARGGLNSARGPDDLAYSHVMTMADDDLADLFQQCLSKCDAPQVWLTAFLAAIEKRGKRPTHPESYRNIGLESCLLKVLTLLIERRLREWAEKSGRIPPNQNGFRQGHRTINNLYTFRLVVEQARVGDEQIWVAFVDLSNAFPTVDQASLWAKLATWGVTGPIVDWIKMLYNRMQYVVRFGGDISETFRALAGILIGDPMSPCLWNIYLSDFMPPAHADDVFLNGVRVAYLAQADDIALISKSRNGLQSKLDAFNTWCRRNGMAVNALKSFLMIFGPLPDVPPVVTIAGERIQLVSSTVYVGVTMTSTTPHIYADHRAYKAKVARRIANVTLAMEGYIGSVPPRYGRLLYLARIDPHLTYGCEADIDVHPSSLHPLETVQLTYLRRVLMLSSRSPLVILYTMLNIWPLRYRRLQLAVRYLAYLVQSDAPTFPKAAMHTAVHLARAGHPSWWNDLKLAFNALPVPVHMDIHIPPSTHLAAHLQNALRESLTQYVLQGVAVPRLELYRTILVTPLGLAPSLAKLFSSHVFLTLAKMQRKCLTRLLVCEHPFAAHRRRFLHDGTPPAWWICRFCRDVRCVEDEGHVLFECVNDDLIKARTRAFRDMLTIHPPLEYVLPKRTDVWDLLRFFARHPRLLARFADFVHTTFKMCDEVPMIIITLWNDLAELGPRP